MSYYNDWKPTPDFIRSHHVSNLERAFARVNESNRDWNYWCDLDGWNIGKWIDSMLADAGVIEAVLKNPKVTELTEKAITIFSAARLNHIDPTEFQSVVAKLREVLE